MNTDLIILKNFIESHPADAARILEGLQIKDIVPFIKEIPLDLVVRIFTHLERYAAVKSLETLNVERSAKIIELLPLEIAVVFLRRMNKKLRDPLLNLVSEEISVPLRRMLHYPEDTAGALIDPLVLTLPEDITVKEALKRVQKRLEKAIYYLYLVKRDNTLAGVINMRELMLARPEDQLVSVMHTNVARLSAEANFQAILNHPGWLAYYALPVVDRSSIFLGAIRYATLRQIERDSRKRPLPRQAIIASNALGELYRIGLSGLFRSAAESYRGPGK